jgi:hypothetical protein
MNRTQNAKLAGRAESGYKAALPDGVIKPMMARDGVLV